MKLDSKWKNRILSRSLFFSLLEGKKKKKEVNLDINHANMVEVCIYMVVDLCKRRKRHGAFLPNQYILSINYPVDTV